MYTSKTILCDFELLNFVHTKALGGTPSDTMTYDPDTVRPSIDSDAEESHANLVASADLVTGE